MEANEKEFEQLRQLSYALAMNMMKNHDDAEDVAQNTLFQFISANDVQNAEAWTKKVTHHLVVEKFRDQKKTMNISHKLNVNESEDEKTTRKKKELIDFNHLTQEKIKQYLSTSERKNYNEFSKCGFSVKKYADKFKITYNVAMKTLQKIRHNLKAGYFKEFGSKYTSTLNYHQSKVIYTLIRRHYLNNDNAPFPLDQFLQFCYVPRQSSDQILVIGLKNNTPVFFVINGKFIKNHFKVQNVVAPFCVQKISNEERAKILSDEKTKKVFFCKS